LKFPKANKYITLYRITF